LTSPRTTRGFLQFLFSNPLLLLCAALGIALVFAGLGLKVYKAKYEGEYKKRLAVEAVVEQMVATAKQVADANERIVESWKQALLRNKNTAAAERTSLRAELERVRNNPVDPSGAAIPVTSCPAPGTDGVSPKLVPLAQYESLQERAAYDALQVTQLQDYINATREVK